MRVTILARPVSISLRRVTWVLSHFVTLGRTVRGVRAGVCWARRGDGWIYRYVGVRLDIWSVMMAVMLPIV